MCSLSRMGQAVINYPFANSQQQLYIRAHPVVFWLCAGLAVEGVFGAFAPQLLVASVASQALPDWLERIFFGVYMIGGISAVIAQLRGLPKLEAAGMSLLATAFLVQFLSIIYLLHTYFWQGLFLLTLSIGAQQRSAFLVRFGYPMRVVHNDDGTTRLGGRTDGGD